MVTTLSSLAIHKVEVAGHPADFTHHDPLTNITMGGQAEAQDCHRHPELKRKIYSALQESDEGELSISIPPEVPLKQSSHPFTGLSFNNDGESNFLSPNHFPFSLPQFQLQNLRHQDTPSPKRQHRSFPLLPSTSPTVCAILSMDLSSSCLMIHIPL